MIATGFGSGVVEAALRPAAQRQAREQQQQQQQLPAKQVPIERYVCHILVSTVNLMPDCHVAFKFSSYAFYVVRGKKKRRKRSTLLGVMMGTCIQKQPETDGA